MTVHFTIVEDSREKRPLAFVGPQVVRRKLAAGDYSILGAEHRVAFERKGVHDFISCVRRERCRFETQLERLAAYQYSAVVIEASYDTFKSKFWFSQATPDHIYNAIAVWSTWGVPLILVGSATGAASYITKSFTAIATCIARENRHIFLKEDQLCIRTSQLPDDSLQTPS